jgi:hypothetical protein
MKRLIISCVALMSLGIPAWTHGSHHNGSGKGRDECCSQGQCRQGQTQDKSGKRQNRNCPRQQTPAPANTPATPGR